MSESDPEHEIAIHRDHFRGRVAIALDANAKITSTLANAIRISPMDGCIDLGAIEYCRELMGRMATWLDQAEESARAVQAAESCARLDAKKAAADR